jgi:hypothetical protein
MHRLRLDQVILIITFMSGKGFSAAHAHVHVHTLQSPARQRRELASLWSRVATLSQVITLANHNLLILI